MAATPSPNYSDKQLLAAEMTERVEYSVVTMPANDAAALSDQLNARGSDGWEIAAMHPLAGSSYLIIFKRGKR
jgi:hypothetical protein